jgi:peptide chain release factor 3
MALIDEIKKRRTFAIISHPDAGKTTLTEKLLLYGGAIQMAGTVKAKRSKKFATSDWMELEKQRGISVTSSVMNFPYGGCEINLIDTPGHQDFSEDTYRTLTAVDSALMLIDAANGVESQTKKLFEVCALQKTPTMAFVNKMDRFGRDPFSLIDEIEKVLGIKTFAINWPLGMGPDFRGVYDRVEKCVYVFEKNEPTAAQSTMTGMRKIENMESTELHNLIGKEMATQISDELELLQAAGDHFEVDEYLAGNLAPVFFGSAINNFGVQPMLDALVQLAPYPNRRQASERTVESIEDKFSGFIFKIQANMDPSHRDRVAFLRICSGKFERGMKAFHVRHKKQIRLARPTQFMAQDRSLIDEAYPGDIVGIHDTGLFKIGDTLTEGESLHYIGIPVFAPEIFVRVVLLDPLKSKQLAKGLDQLSEEGAVQVFRPSWGNDQYLGVVGALQFDVVKYRLEAEYSVLVRFEGLPYTVARWVKSKKPEKLEVFLQDQARKVVFDQHQAPAVLLDSPWMLQLLQDKNPDIQFFATAESVTAE